MPTITKAIPCSLCLVLLTLAACKNGPESNTPVKPIDPPAQPVKEPKRLPASDFIADRELDPVTKADKGPLLHYTLKLDDVLDRSQTTHSGVVTGSKERDHKNPGASKATKLVGEAIVFGLPEGKGDTGQFYREVTLKRAAELYANTPDEAKVADEMDLPGTLALVQFETLGFPSGRSAGDDIPVVIVPQGNATDLTGGHIYGTSLRNERTREVMAYHSYGSFEPGEIRILETYQRNAFDALDEVIDPKAQPAPTPAKPASDDPKTKPAAGGPVSEADAAASRREIVGEMVLPRFLLMKGFRLRRSTGWAELGRSEVTLAIGPERTEDGNRTYSLTLADEVIDGVVEAVAAMPTYLIRREEYEERQREERRKRAGVARTDAEKQSFELTLELLRGLKINVERVPRSNADEPYKVLCVPSMLLRSMDDLYDTMRTLRCKVRPRRQIHIIADNQFGRIIICGPSVERKLTDRLTYSTEIDDSAKAKPPHEFKVVATPTRDMRELDVTWSRLKQGIRAADGSQRIANDIGELLRVVYGAGATPDDCFFMISEAKKLRRINAEFALNPERLKPRTGEGDR